MKSTSNKTVITWIKIADYDLETAKAMNLSRRYIYVAFTCQQCIEKLLKALFVKFKKESPPYSHNLIRLIELTEIKLDKEQVDFVNLLNAFYIKSRYSEEISKLSKSLNKKQAGLLLEQTQKLSKWLKIKLK